MIALNSPISVGHINSVELTFIFKMRINVGQINFQPYQSLVLILYELD